MRFRIGLASAVAVCAGGLIAAGAAISAQAATENAPATPSTADPTLSPESAMDQQWRATAADFPEGLPAGYRFPDTAPSFFHPVKTDPTQVDVFEDGLVQQFVAEYWRCAWLETEVTATDKADTVAADRAVDALAAWARVPGSNANTPGFPAYYASLATQAAKTGATAAALEFANDCGFIHEGEGAK